MIGVALALEAAHLKESSQKQDAVRCKLGRAFIIYLPLPVYCIYMEYIWNLLTPLAEMRFLQWVAGLSLRDKVRSVPIWEGFRIELLLLYTETKRVEVV